MVLAFLLGIVVGAVYTHLNENTELICIYLSTAVALTVRTGLIRGKSELTDKSMESVTLRVKTIAATEIFHISLR